MCQTRVRTGMHLGARYISRYIEIVNMVIMHRILRVEVVAGDLDVFSAALFIIIYLFITV